MSDAPIIEEALALLGEDRDEPADDPIRQALQFATEVRPPDANRYPALVPPEYVHTREPGVQGQWTVLPEVDSTYSWYDKTGEWSRPGQLKHFELQSARRDYQARIWKHVINEPVLTFEEFREKHRLPEDRSLPRGLSSERLARELYAVYLQNVANLQRDIAKTNKIGGPQDMYIPPEIPPLREVEKTDWWAAATEKDRTTARSLYSRLDQWSRIRPTGGEPRIRPGSWRVVNLRLARVLERMEKPSADERRRRELNNFRDRHETWRIETLRPVSPDGQKLVDNADEFGFPPMAIGFLEGVAKRVALSAFRSKDVETTWRLVAERHPEVQHPQLRAFFRRQFNFWAGHAVENREAAWLAAVLLHQHGGGVATIEQKVHRESILDKVGRMDEKDRRVFLSLLHEHLAKRAMPEERWSIIEKLLWRFSKSSRELVPTILDFRHSIGLSGAEAEARYLARREVERAAEVFMPQGETHVERAAMAAAQTLPAWMAVWLIAKLVGAAGAAGVVGKLAMGAKGVSRLQNLAQLAFWTSYIAPRNYVDFRREFKLDRGVASVMAVAAGALEGWIENLQVRGAFGEAGGQAAKAVRTTFRKRLLSFIKQHGLVWIGENTEEFFQGAGNLLFRAAAAHISEDVDFDVKKEFGQFQQELRLIPTTMAFLIGPRGAVQLARMPAQVRAQNALAEFEELRSLVAEDLRAQGHGPAEWAGTRLFAEEVKGEFGVPPGTTPRVQLGEILGESTISPEPSAGQKVGTEEGGEGPAMEAPVEEWRDYVDWEALEDFAMAFPREAQALSELTEPSRRQFQELTGSEDAGNKEQRAMIARVLRKGYFQGLIGAPPRAVSEAEAKLREAEERLEAEGAEPLTPAEAEQEWVRWKQTYEGWLATSRGAWPEKERALREGRMYMPFARRGEIERMRRLAGMKPTRPQARPKAPEEPKGPEAPRPAAEEEVERRREILERAGAGENIISPEMEPAEIAEIWRIQMAGEEGPRSPDEEAVLKQKGRRVQGVVEALKAGAWQSVRDLIGKPEPSESDLRGMAADVNWLLTWGFSQRAFDKKGNVYYAQKGIDLPAWLTESAERAEQKKLPDMDLASRLTRMTYRQLQKEAKRLGIAANQKRELLIERIIQESEGEERPGAEQEPPEPAPEEGPVPAGVEGAIPPEQVRIGMRGTVYPSEVDYKGQRGEPMEVTITGEKTEEIAGKEIEYWTGLSEVAGMRIPVQFKKTEPFVPARSQEGVEEAEAEQKPVEEEVEEREEPEYEPLGAMEKPVVIELDDVFYRGYIDNEGKLHFREPNEARWYGEDELPGVAASIKAKIDEARAKRSLTWASETGLGSPARPVRVEAFGGPIETYIDDAGRLFFRLSAEDEYQRADEDMELTLRALVREELGKERPPQLRLRAAERVTAPEAEPEAEAQPEERPEPPEGVTPPERSPIARLSEIFGLEERFLMPSKIELMRQAAEQGFSYIEMQPAEEGAPGHINIGLPWYSRAETRPGPSVALEQFLNQLVAQKVLWTMYTGVVRPPDPGSHALALQRLQAFYSLAHLLKQVDFDPSSALELLEAEESGAPTEPEAEATGQQRLEQEIEQQPFEPEAERIWVNVPVSDPKTEDAQVARELEARAKNPCQHKVAWGNLSKDQQTRLTQLVRALPEVMLDPALEVRREGGTVRLIFHDKIKVAFVAADFGLEAEQLADGDRIRLPVEQVNFAKKTARKRVVSGEYTPTPREQRPRTARTTPKALPKPPKKITAKTVLKILEVMTADEQARFAMNGVGVDRHALIVTDGKRLFVVKYQNAAKELGVEVPRRDAKDFALPVLATDGKTLIEGHFPDYEAVIPDDDYNQPTVMSLDLEDVWRKLQQVAQIETKESLDVRVYLNRDLSLGFRTQTLEGYRANIGVEADAVHVGALSLDYLQQVVGAHLQLGAKTARMWWHSPGDPMVLWDSKGHKSILMPVTFYGDEGPSAGLNFQQIELWKQGKDPHSEDLPLPGEEAEEEGEEAPGAGAGAMAAIRGNLSQVKNSQAEARRTAPDSGDLAPKNKQKKVEKILEATNVTGAVESLKSYFDSFLKMVAPTARGKIAQVGARLIRRRFADLMRRTMVAQEHLRGLRRAFWFMSREDAVAFLDRMEAGEPQPTPKLQRVAEAIRELLDKYEQVVKDHGLLDSFIENYFPHVWQEPYSARHRYAQLLGRRPLAGPRGFQKKRTIPTFTEGIEAGFTPLSWNPVDLVMFKVREIEKCLMAHRMVDDMNNRGFIRFRYIRSRGLADMTRIHDNFFTVFLPPEITIKEAYDKTLWENLLSLCAQLGVDHERVEKMRGRVWGKAQGERYIKTRFAGPVDVAFHELGHIIGQRYDLFEWMTRKGDTSREAIDERKVIQDELRALADARMGDRKSKYYQKYVRTQEEKEAVVLQAFIYATERMDDLAPTVKKKFTQFLGDHPELRPLLGMKRDLVLGESEGTLKVPGVTTIGHYEAPDQMATLLNNQLSPGFRGSPSEFISGTYDGMRMLGNVMNQANLSVSAFHGLFTAVTTTTNQFAIGLREVAATWGMQLPGAYKMLTFPAAPITTPLRGKKLLAALRTPIEQIRDPRMRKLVEAFVVGGGRGRMPEFYYNRAINALRRSLEQVVRGPLREKIWGGAKMPVVGIGAALEALTKPILHWYVPMVKVGAFMMMAEHEMERLHTDNLSDDKLAEALTHVWDRCDDRFGQLVYDNLFWNRFLRDGLMLLLRSVGWNFGSLREYTGAAKDVLFTWRRLKAGDAWMSHRMAHATAEVFLFALMGSLLQYFMTGEWPRELRDYFYPRSGRINPDGSPERIMLPSYAKDWLGWTTQPLTTVSNKAHPLLALMVDAWQNEDFYGTEIRHPGDPIPEQIEQLVEYTGRQFLPFSVRNIERLRESGWPKTQAMLMGLGGILPCPAYITQTPAQGKMIQFLVDRIPQGSRTREQFDRSRERKRIILDLRAGKEVDWQDLQTEWSGPEIRRIMQMSREPLVVNQFKRLRFAEALQVYQLANRRERELWKDILIGKYRRADRTDPGFNDWQALFATLMGEDVDIGKPLDVQDELRRSHRQYIASEAWALSTPPPQMRVGETMAEFAEKQRRYDERLGRARYALDQLEISPMEALAALVRHAKSRRMNLSGEAFQRRRRYLLFRARALGEPLR